MSAPHNEATSSQASRRTHQHGFLLSAILTVVPFWLVLSGGLASRALTALVLVLFAVVQIIVHMVCFLHMDVRTEKGWVALSLIFTLVVLLISVAGSLWIMYHLNANMMQMDPGAARNMP
ncbi:cytochrome o ubiquinol oxidase subunit IV [Agrobacterium pusense]|uniref:cytochrome o ubiquinol oxidase subunit IV n=1 Tax=Agrobacterium pusense TaxID=648995 RepID=UPI000882402D|nr:cytochrome o ubiquinol oxidase subunit IV [Agrobacterium pusense]OOO19692.1 cytochrome o ubiquinol oxidase subunit IV [Agrobacterium pusense]WKD47916.1 cytochrome o ubiquinol oxidase subunit IV [Agrobacterium pusense]SDF63355.1 cytochrome bo3 quinol oxidase subunit 4 [Agrobacterium pusense]